MKEVFIQKKIERVRIFTEDVKNEITSLHLRGYSHDEICEELSILKNTCLKALSQGRLFLPALPAEAEHTDVSTKSSRSILDNTTGMGKSCTNELSRVLASRIGIPAKPVFGNHIDLSYGGLLLTVPSLIACGLLRHILVLCPSTRIPFRVCEWLLYRHTSIHLTLVSHAVTGDQT